MAQDGTNQQANSLGSRRDAHFVVVQYSVIKSSTFNLPHLSTATLLVNFTQRRFA
jgi:hypothetical protein